MKVTERFSDRVENYIRYRPHYPPEIIPFLESEIQLSSSSIVADIGSGTGISAEIFLENGNTVFGIEPNTEMRAAGKRLLSGFSSFHSINGTAESTTLPDHSIDIIVAGQAFHWFDIPKAKLEFHRILNPGGWVVLIWNQRMTDSTPFLIAYENLLNNFGTDYKTVNHIHAYGSIDDLFQTHGKCRMSFPNSQTFDYEGLEGRLLSSSYTPTPTDSRFKPMLAQLRRIFERFEKEGKVELLYLTELYYGRLDQS